MVAAELGSRDSDRAGPAPGEFREAVAPAQAAAPVRVAGLAPAFGKAEQAEQAPVLEAVGPVVAAQDPTDLAAEGSAALALPVGREAVEFLAEPAAEGRASAVVLGLEWAGPEQAGEKLNSQGNG